MAKMTYNQYVIKKLADKYGINIFCYLQEKTDLWNSGEHDNGYECDDCGKERTLSQPYSNGNSICWECFNECNKLPFYSYDNEWYDDNAPDIPEFILDSFKNDVNWITVRDKLRSIKYAGGQLSLLSCIRNFEVISGYKYYPNEPGYTFIRNDSSRHNITFMGNEIHTSKNDIDLSDEFRKSVGWNNSKRSEGTYLIFTKWLKPMIALQEAIKREEEKKEAKNG